MTAYMNAGRWVVDCPDPDCASAERVGPIAPNTRYNEDTVVVCDNCKRITKVVWPDERDEVDRLVGVRPVPETRNWRGPWNPDEPVESLRLENETHGI